MDSEDLKNHILALPFEARRKLAAALLESLVTRETVVMGSPAEDTDKRVADTEQNVAFTNEIPCSDFDEAIVAHQDDTDV